MDLSLTKKELKLIRFYEIRLRYATNMAEVSFCKNQIRSIIEKARDNLL